MSSKLPKQRPTNHPQVQQTIVGVTKQETSMFVGPLPAPEMLEEYERIYPGTAERILRMAEKEQESRHNQKQQLIDLERKNQRSLNFNIRLGSFLAFASVLVSSAMCIYFAHLGGIEVAGDTAKYVIVSLALAFITGRLVQTKLPKEREKEQG